MQLWDEPGGTLRGVDCGCAGATLVVCRKVHAAPQAVDDAAFPCPYSNSTVQSVHHMSVVACVHVTLHGIVCIVYCWKMKGVFEWVFMRFLLCLLLCSCLR